MQNACQLGTEASSGHQAMSLLEQLFEGEAGLLVCLFGLVLLEVREWLVLEEMLAEMAPYLVV